MTHAEQVIALSEALTASRWNSTGFRNDLYRIISTDYEYLAELKRLEGMQ